MRKVKNALVVLVVLALCLTPFVLSGCGSTTTGKADPYEAARVTARTEVWQDINSGKASSASVAIMDGGNVVYAEGIGVADRESETPATSGTLYNIGSSSKTFDAAALMKLVDQGKVKLDDPVTKYLPEFKMEDPRYKDVTVRMLLNHTSGFPGTDYANNMGYAFNDKVYEDTLANLARSHLKAAPGQTAPYCNDGFTLAEMIVARVTGKKFMDAVESMLLQPLSLNRTGLSVGERKDDGIARYYQADTGKIVPPEVLSVIGAGGISSTAQELVLFMDSFAKGGHHVLSDASIAEMMKPQPSVFAQAAVKETGVNPEMNYGLGFDFTSVSKYDAQGIKVVGKGGDSDDYHSMMLLVPEKRIAVAVIEAGHGSSAPAIAYSILDSLLEAKGLTKAPKQSVVPPAQQPLPASYAKYAGFYGGDTQAFKLDLDFDNNVVDLTILKNGMARGPVPLTYRDGSLYLASGTEFKLISAEGRDMILSAVDGGYMTFGQKLTPVAQPRSLEPGIDGVQWLRRNVKPYEAMSASTDSEIATSVTIPDAPGYLSFRGIKKVTSGNAAGMTTDAIRDITELTLFDANGSKWARVSDCIYSPADTTAAALGAGNKSVSIGKEGYNEWLKATSDLVITVRKPTEGRVIVFAPDNSVLYDSEIDSGEALVPAGGLVELAGNAGQVLTVDAAPAGK